ncbi:MAG TPA: 4Fe-4S dicluster domain-containing protein [Acidimicrobiales bacterium]|nr:4Fe-4S dicluster domain-containing protein [Acidimicrobiales bacterium]
MSPPPEPTTVPGLLALDHYELDEGRPHISIDHDVCRTRCTVRACLTVCPADVYREEDDGRIVPDVAGCLECGTCVVTCLPEALSWRYPGGGKGIQYRYG